jgi:heavy metal efflux system protein
MRKNFLKIVFLTFCPWSLLWAQTTITLDNAVAEAIKNNPSVKSSEYQYQAQRTMMKTSFDWGKTNVVLMRGQYNSLNTDNNLTITQSIPFPTVSASEIKYNQALAASAEQNMIASQNDLAFQVKASFTRLQYVIALHQLLQNQDTLYRNFTNAASLRYKTGESNLLEKTTAETQWMEIRNQLQVNDRDASIEQTHLQTLLHSAQKLIPAESLAPFVFSRDQGATGLAENPMLNYWRHQKDASIAMKRVEHNRFLPDITIGYFNQSLIGFQRTGTTETFYDKSKRFTGWVFGVSLPLWFLPQTGRAQAASLNQAAAQKHYEGYQRQLEGQFEQAVKELEKNQSSLDYYEKSAVPNARLILTQSQRAYRGGEISYVEYLQALKQSYSIQANYLLAIYQYNLSVLQLEYLLGKK